MLGVNHALYGVAGWFWLWPYLAFYSPDVKIADFEIMILTTAIAAGASVIPDLDHPDARPSKHFGVLSRMVAKSINKASGGHRQATHTIAFAIGLAILTYSIRYLPGDYGNWIAAIVCGFCCSLGVALMAPSLRKKSPFFVNIGVALATGFYVYHYFEDIKNLLPIIASYGVIIHIACDWVTKGGVPILWPISKKRLKVGLFRVGGKGEAVATYLGALALMAGVIRLYLLMG